MGRGGILGRKEESLVQLFSAESPTSDREVLGSFGLVLFFFLHGTGLVF